MALLILTAGSGCSPSPEPITPKPIDTSLPSKWQINDVRYSPEVTVPERDLSGKDFYWQAVDFQKDGEEKIQFERKEGKPSFGIKPVAPKIQMVGTLEDMAAVREMSRHLVSAYRRENLPVAQFGFGPFGVSNDLYFGHTFWDMDVWMLPTLLFIDPPSVKSIAKYRLDRVAQAIKNYGATYPGPDEKTGMKFPWESSVSGKEVCLAKTRFQEHISGDVVWGMTQAEAMGLVPSGVVSQVGRGVDIYYRDRSFITSRGREIKDVTSPNEKFTGDNDLYTNLLAEWIHNDRQWKGTPTYYLPKDDKSFLNYDNDPLRDYQQVAGLLSIYPLQYPEAEKQALTMLKRFEPGLSKNGPAMGHSIIATIYARLGQPRKAYKAWKESWAPYLTGPNRLFSERNKVSKTYFYTGAAGALNTVIYGFGGFRLDRSPLKDAKWTKKLKSGWWLSCKPSVPGEIGKIIFNGIQIDDQKYDFEMSSTGGFSAKISTLKG